VKSTLLYFKEARLCFTKHLAGEPLSPKDLKYSIGLTKEGLPKVIGGFIPIIRRGITPNELRVLMTLLTIGRSFQVPPEVSSLDSITLANEECDQVIEDLGDDFEDFVKRFAKKHFGSPMKYDFQKFHLTLSHGPSGPALRSSL